MALAEPAGRNADPDADGKRRSADTIMSRGYAGVLSSSFVPESNECLDLSSRLGLPTPEGYARVAHGHASYGDRRRSAERGHERVPPGLTANVTGSSKAREVDPIERDGG